MNLSISLLIAFAVHHPALQAAALILATFILEDAATILAAVQAASGTLSIPLVIGSLYDGIVIGDAGLYGPGRLAARFPWVRRRVQPRRAEVVRKWLHGRLFRVVLVSRFLPGVRLPVYTGTGFLGVSFRKFILASTTGTVFWTSGLFFVSMKIGSVLIAHFGVWRWAGYVGMVAVILLGTRSVAHLWKNLPDKYGVPLKELRECRSSVTHKEQDSINHR